MPPTTATSTMAVRSTRRTVTVAALGLAVLVAALWSIAEWAPITNPAPREACDCQEDAPLPPDAGRPLP